MGTTSFVIQSDNPDQAGRFYARAFNMTVKLQNGSLRLESPDARTYGRIESRTRRNLAGPATIRVDSVEQALEAISTNGGRVVVAKRAIPGVGYMAYCEDPEGNAFSVFSKDKAAG